MQHPSQIAPNVYIINYSLILLLVLASLQTAYHTKWYWSIFTTHTSTTHNVHSLRRALAVYQLNLAVVP
eukprot:scaffold5499_cov137-Skeletonema_dohrnii-CCMP3373.AAC.7